LVNPQGVFLLESLTKAKPVLDFVLVVKDLNSLDTNTHRLEHLKNKKFDRGI
jgi:hypothetical protein